MSYSAPAAGGSSLVQTKNLFGADGLVSIANVGFTDFGASGYAKLTDIPGATVVADLPTGKYIVERLQYGAGNTVNIKVAITLDGVDMIDTAPNGLQLAGADKWDYEGYFRISTGRRTLTTDNYGNEPVLGPIYVEGALKITAAYLATSSTKNLKYLVREIA